MHREKMGCWNVILIIGTGFIIYILWATQRKRPFRCATCGKLFHARTPGGKISLALLWVMLALAIAGLVLEEFR
jgi:hypothetical protein